MRRSDYQLQISLLKEALNCKLPTDKEKQLALFSQLDPNTMSAFAFCIASGFECEISADGVHPFVEAVVCLNCYTFDNLRDLFWSVITANYNEYVTRVLIDLINDDALKVKVLECLKDEVQNLNDDDKQAFGVDNGTFIDFCNKKIAYIQNQGLYSIEAIKARQNERLKAFEDRDSRLELPDVLQSDYAQGLLQRAVEAGLCKTDSQGRYKWEGKSDTLLAYFMGRLTCDDFIEPDGVWRKRGLLSDKSLSIFWNVKNLGQKRIQAYNAPKGHEEVDKLFKPIS